MEDKIRSKYSADAAANYFIQKSLDEGIEDLTPMQLQKLVYIGLGWCLAVENTDIIGGDPVQAWQHGPVIPSLYHSIKHYKGSPVTELILSPFCAYDNEGNQISEPEPEVIPKADVNITNVLDAVWNVYKHETGNALRTITHNHETPWRMHYKPGQRNVDIPKETIKAFYSLLKEKSE